MVLNPFMRGDRNKQDKSGKFKICNTVMSVKEKKNTEKRLRVGNTSLNGMDPGGLERTKILPS